MRYIRRAIEAAVLRASAQFPAVFVTGPRQTGKTTLLRRLADEGRRYVSLDIGRNRALAQDDPELFIQQYPPPVLIDEVQYAPGLLPAIKQACDSRGEAGLFWLTGSQQFTLMQGVSESLAGRVAILRLNGLSARETGADARSERPETAPLTGAESCSPRGMGTDASELFRTIFRGSLPAFASGAREDRELFFGSYVQTYLERDVRNLAHVGDLEAFDTFLRVLAARTGCLLNLSELARDCAISPPTAKHWLSILEASDLVYLLRPWHSNATKRLVKSPKLYFLDTGLCAYLAGWDTPESLAAGAMRGSIFETWCVSEALKSWWYAARRPPFWFYRDRDGKEIDLVIERDGALVPIEMKLGTNPGRDWIRHFTALEGTGREIGPGVALCLVDEPFPIDGKHRAVPASWI